MNIIKVSKKLKDCKYYVVAEPHFYRVEEQSYAYGYVPALELKLFNVVTRAHVDDIYIFCLRGYDLRAAKNKDLNGRSEGISSGISLYDTTRWGIYIRIIETVNNYLARPDTVKYHGGKLCFCGSAGSVPIPADPEVIKFIDSTIEFVESIRKEEYRLKRC